MTNHFSVLYFRIQLYGSFDSMMKDFATLVLELNDELKQWITKLTHLIWFLESEVVDDFMGKIKTSLPLRPCRTRGPLLQKICFYKHLLSSSGQNKDRKT